MDVKRSDGYGVELGAMEQTWLVVIDTVNKAQKCSRFLFFRAQNASSRGFRAMRQHISAERNAPCGIGP